MTAPHENPSFREAWDATAGDDFASRLARQSLSALATKTDPAWKPLGSQLTASMRDTEHAGSLLDPWSISKVLAGLHDAAARLYRAARRGSNVQTRLTADDRAAVNLGIAGAVGGSLTVQISGTPVLDPKDALFAARITPLDIAFTRLIQILSQDDLSDAHLIDDILTTTPVLRRAIRDLVEHDAAERIDLQLALDKADGSKLSGSLTGQRAALLKEALTQQEESLSTETRTGVLDGYRTSRKVFYFISDDNSEIEGVVGDSLEVSDIQSFTDRRVEIDLGVTTTRHRGGGRATKHYRLEAIRIVPIET
ncbi:hypothetical protein ABJI51_21265 [Amycolatopsis sp. NEAU-NG30]|uniref:Uncharacterized protein n=1 Tax=Amycolatopsis melonis TaxID=3156488 RepID=A0ABV0LJT6_9PSEU